MFSLYQPRPISIDIHRHTARRIRSSEKSGPKTLRGRRIHVNNLRKHLGLEITQQVCERLETLERFYLHARRSTNVSPSASSRPSSCETASTCAAASFAPSRPTEVADSHQTAKQSQHYISRYMIFGITVFGNKSWSPFQRTRSNIPEQKDVP